MKISPLALSIPYLLAGVILDVSDEYLTDVDTLKEIGSAVLAVVLWPLLLLGVDLNIR